MNMLGFSKSAIEATWILREGDRVKPKSGRFFPKNFFKKTLLGIGFALIAVFSQEGEEAGEIVFQELDLGEALVIEGRVEKPQVQFPLLMEKPPVNPIRFEMSFRDKMLELSRENVPDISEPSESGSP
jgi:hypothetical protein